jgi:hypothetical protein
MTSSSKTCVICDKTHIQAGITCGNIVCNAKLQMGIAFAKGNKVMCLSCSTPLNCSVHCQNCADAAPPPPPPEKKTERPCVLCKWNPSMSRSAVCDSCYDKCSKMKCLNCEKAPARVSITFRRTDLLCSACFHVKQFPTQEKILQMLQSFPLICEDGNCSSLAGANETGNIKHNFCVSHFRQGVRSTMITEKSEKKMCASCAINYAYSNHSGNPTHRWCHDCAQKHKAMQRREGEPGLPTSTMFPIPPKLVQQPGQ